MVFEPMKLNNCKAFEVNSAAAVYNADKSGFSGWFTKI